MLALMMVFFVSISNVSGQPTAFSKVAAKVTDNQTLDEKTGLDSQQALKLEMIMPAEREAAADRYKAAQANARAAAPGIMAPAAAPVADPGGFLTTSDRTRTTPTAPFQKAESPALL